MDSSLCVPLCACRHGWGGVGWGGVGHLLTFMWTCFCVCRYVHVDMGGVGWGGVGWGGACVNVHVNLLGKWTRLCVSLCACRHGWGGVGHVVTFMWTCSVSFRLLSTDTSCYARVSARVLFTDTSGYVLASARVLWTDMSCYALVSALVLWTDTSCYVLVSVRVLFTDTSGYAL